MSDVSLTLLELNPDKRDNQVSYKLEIKNVSPSAVINLLDIQLQLPPKAELKELKSTSGEADRQQKEDLCQQIAQTLSEVLFARSLLYRRKLHDTLLAEFRNLLGSTGFFKVYWSMFRGQFESHIRTATVGSRALLFKISSADEANTAKRMVFEQTSLPGENANLFTDMERVVSLKILQLTTLESKLVTNQRGRAVLGSLQPGGTSSRTYVVKFPRRTWSPSRYNIALDIEYVVGDRTESHKESISESFSISPKSLTLTLSAAIGAILASALLIIGAEKQGFALTWEYFGKILQ